MGARTPQSKLCDNIKLVQLGSPGSLGLLGQPYQGVKCCNPKHLGLLGCMSKILSAKQKADELGISLRALAKTRHLYKHIPKSPRKYLYFAEDQREAVRPNIGQSSVKSRSGRRRNVPFGEENYHKAPGGSGEKLKVLNQMRAKASLEKKGSPEEIKSMDLALAIKIKDNHKEIVEQKRAETLSRVYQENERLRKKDPSRYGSMNPRTPLINFSTPWKDLYPQEKSEYDRALEDLQGDNLGDKKYY